MARFHINPETGNPNLCKATRRCPFGDLERDHYASKAEAQKAYEQKNASFKAKGYDWPAESETRTFKSRRGEVTFQLSDKFNRMQTHHSAQAWLTIPGEGNVAFVSLLVKDETSHSTVGEHLAMCDIETRVDARKQGYARELREAIEKETGLLIYSSGGYTPEGWDAFSKHARYLPRPEGEDPIYADYYKPEVKYKSQGFVLSWEHQLPVNFDSEIDYTDAQHDASDIMEDRYQKFRNHQITWAED